jgi:hypothetical protein
MKAGNRAAVFEVAMRRTVPLQHRNLVLHFVCELRGPSLSSFRHSGEGRNPLFLHHRLPGLRSRPKAEVIGKIPSPLGRCAVVFMREQNGRLFPIAQIRIFQKIALSQRVCRAGKPGVCRAYPAIA